MEILECIFIYVFRLSIYIRTNNGSLRARVIIIIILPASAKGSVIFSVNMVHAYVPGSISIAVKASGKSCLFCRTSIVERNKRSQSSQQMPNERKSKWQRQLPPETAKMRHNLSHRTIKSAEIIFLSCFAIAASMTNGIPAHIFVNAKRRRSSRMIDRGHQHDVKRLVERTVRTNQLRIALVTFSH